MSRYYEPLIWHQRGVRSHSVLNDRSQAMPVRRHEPVYVPQRSSHYSSYHDYGIDDSINRADYLSNAVLEDTFDQATRSRGKDHALLRNLNAAIVSTERHVNPRVAAVSRRVRASSVPPVARSFPGHFVHPQQYSQVAEPHLLGQSSGRPVVIFIAPNSNDAFANRNLRASTPVVLAQSEAPWYVRARASSVPPPDPRSVRASSVPAGYRRVQPVYHPPNPFVTANLWAHRPVALRSNVLRNARARSLEPSSMTNYYARPRFQPSIPSTQLWAHRPRVLSKDYGRLARARSEERSSNPGRLYRSTSVPRIYDRTSDYYYTLPSVQERALSRYLYAHRGRFGPDSKPPRASLGAFPQVYVPWTGEGPSNRSKAAVIGSRLEAASGVKAQRRPRSEFAAKKLRELKMEEIEDGIYYRVPVSSALYASRPPLPKPTDRKSIRDNDGFTRPKNLLSWQPRSEPQVSSVRRAASASRSSRHSMATAPAPRATSARPECQTSPRSTFVALRTTQARTLSLPPTRSNYFPLPRLTPIKKATLPPVTIERPKINLNVTTRSTLSVGGSSVKIPNYYAAGADPNNLPMSDLRRKLRRTIAKGKNNPDYYRG